MTTESYLGAPPKAPKHLNVIQMFSLSFFSSTKASAEAEAFVRFKYYV